MKLFENCPKMCPFKVEPAGDDSFGGDFLGEGEADSSREVSILSLYTPPKNSVFMNRLEGKRRELWQTQATSRSTATWKTPARWTSTWIRQPETGICAWKCFVSQICKCSLIYDMERWSWTRTVNVHSNHVMMEGIHEKPLISDKSSECWNSAMNITHLWCCRP